MSLSNGATLHLLVALSLILLAAHGMGFAFVRLRQPQVAGEIVGGLLPGPTVLGALRPDLTHQFIASNVDKRRARRYHFFEPAGADAPRSNWGRG